MKEKYEALLKHSQSTRNENSYDFGDISNISVTHSTASKKMKTQELSALKQRLQNIKIDKLLPTPDRSMLKSRLLPSEV